VKIQDKKRMCVGGTKTVKSAIQPNNHRNKIPARTYHTYVISWMRRYIRSTCDSCWWWWWWWQNAV